MNDTPRYILIKQFEIIKSKPLKERIMMAFDLTELSRQIIYNQLKNKYPIMSESDLKMELFKIFYKEDFDDTTMQKILCSMKISLENNIQSI